MSAKPPPLQTSMKDDTKTRAQLIEEVRDLRSRLQALEGTLAEHQQSEATLRQTPDRLEFLVRERTTDLAQANAALHAAPVMGSRDLSGQQHVEQSLGLSAERLRLLHNMDQSILEAPSLGAIAHVALSHIRQLIPCQRASIDLLDQATQEITVLAVNADGGPQIQAGMHVPLHMVADTEQLQRGGRLVADADTLPPSFPLDRELRAGGLRSWVNISLIAGGQLIGLLNLGAAQPHFFTAEYLDIGSEAARPLAIALQQTRLQEEIQRQTLELAKTNRELRTEIVERNRAEQALREAHNELEQRVGERTAALATANAALQEEIAERKQAETTLQALSHQLLQAQERERRQIARELHDEIGQALTALKINLDSLQTKTKTSHDSVSSAEIIDRLTDSRNITRQLLQQVRDLSLDLHPSLLDDLGLVAALRWYVDRQAQRMGFVAEVLAEPLEPRPSPTVETVCFRIAQEAVTNMVRHAQARRVQIELCQDAHTLVLRIRDDGVGFDVQAAQEKAIRAGSMGLRGMQERVQLVGGKIETISAPGCGTEIRAYVPLGEKEEEHSI